MLRDVQDVALDGRPHDPDLDGLDGGFWTELDAALNAVVHLILPALALSTIPLAIIVRITRASVLEVVNADYVRTGRAKGAQVINALKRRLRFTVSSWR